MIMTQDCRANRLCHPHKGGSPGTFFCPHVRVHPVLGDLGAHLCNPEPQKTSHGLRPGEGKAGDASSGALGTPSTGPPLGLHTHSPLFSLPTDSFWACRLFCCSEPLFQGLGAPQGQILGIQFPWVTVSPKCPAGSKL